MAGAPGEASPAGPVEDGDAWPELAAPTSAQPEHDAAFPAEPVGLHQSASLSTLLSLYADAGCFGTWKLELGCILHLEIGSGAHLQSAILVMALSCFPTGTDCIQVCKNAWAKAHSDLPLPTVSMINPKERNNVSLAQEEAADAKISGAAEEMSTSNCAAEDAELGMGLFDEGAATRLGSASASKTFSRLATSDVGRLWQLSQVAASEEGLW